MRCLVSVGEDTSLHETEVNEVIYFDYLKLGDSDNGHAYVLAPVDYVSLFVSLAPVKLLREVFWHGCRYWAFPRCSWAMELRSVRVRR